MFQIYFLNFSYFSQEEFTSLEGALEYGKSKGFEFSVYHNDSLVAAWGIFSGTRYYH